MAVVIFHSDLGAQESKVCHCFHFLPVYMPWSDETRCHDLSFFNVVLSQIFHFPLSPSSGLPSLSAIRMVLSAYLRLLIFLPEILIVACDSSSLASCMMYSAYKLNKQDDSIQPCHTPFLIWNQSVVSCPTVTVASWPIYRLLKRQVRWSGTPISLRIFHSVLRATQRL